MSADGGGRVFGFGVLEVKGEDPVAVVSATVLPSERDQFLVVDCVKTQPRVFRVPSDLPLQTPAGDLEWDYFQVEAAIRSLRPQDAQWLSSLDVDELPVQSLSALIDVIALMEVDPDGSGPWALREEGWEGDVIYLESDGTLRYEVVDVRRTVCRAWRRRGEWVLEESPTEWPHPHGPITDEFVRLVVGFIDEGLHPTAEIVELACASPDSDVEVDDAYDVDEHGVRRPIVLRMPMEHYLHSQMHAVRQAAMSTIWPHLDPDVVSTRCEALDLLTKETGFPEVARAVAWIEWRKALAIDPDRGERRILSLSDSAADRRMAASSLDSPPEMLRALARDRDDSVVYAAVSNPQAPADVCWRVLGESAWVVEGLASNPGAPAEVLVDLASLLATCEPVDRDVAFISLVRNPACPEEAALLAVTTGSRLVQGIAAESLTLTPAVLDVLADRLDPKDLERALQSNPLARIGRLPSGRGSSGGQSGAGGT